MQIERNPKELESMEEFHKGNREKALKLQDEFLREFHEAYADQDHCPCKSTTCSLHGNCRDCVAVHRAHQDHIPVCLRPVINSRLKPLCAVTENSIVADLLKPKKD